MEQPDKEQVLVKALNLIVNYPNFISPGEHEETIRKIAREALEQYREKAMSEAEPAVMFLPPCDVCKKPQMEYGALYFEAPIEIEGREGVYCRKIHVCVCCLFQPAHENSTEAELREALRKHGVHKIKCSFNSMDNPEADPECDCGLYQAIYGSTKRPQPYTEKERQIIAEDRGASVQALADYYRTQEYHPVFTRSKWVVASRASLSMPSYWDWVHFMIEYTCKQAEQSS